MGEGMVYSYNRLPFQRSIRWDPSELFKDWRGVSIVKSVRSVGGSVGECCSKRPMLFEETRAFAILAKLGCIANVNGLTTN